MENVSKSIEVNASPTEAYLRFATEVDQWWPKHYRWLDKDNTRLSMHLNGEKTCEEVALDGTIFTWARVGETDDHDHLELIWLIGPDGEHIENEGRASRVKINFIEREKCTEVQLEHSNFEGLGEGAEKYRNILNSDEGWLHLLRSFKGHCE